MTFVERPHENEKNRALSYIVTLLDEARNSKEERTEDIKTLEEIQKLLSTKKYGLVWEQHAEKFEEDMKINIPIFSENNNRKFHNDSKTNNFNFILEGDNLHSLHLLEKTHKSKIDVIYIDPPYNTKKDGFKYNDKKVDNTDGFSHSKWLSFMNKRLNIAKNLLSEDGIIFVSIDNNEQAQLKLLLDEIFMEKNFVANFLWNKSQNPPSLSHTVRHKFEYVLCYKKQKNIKLIGGYTEGGDSPLYNGGNPVSVLKFPANSVIFNIPDGIYEAKDKGKLELMDNVEVKDSSNINSFKLKGQFRWKQDTLEREISEGTKIVIKSKQFSPRYSRFGNRSFIPSDVLSMQENNVDTNERGRKDLECLIPENDFSFPKPISLIKKLISFTSKKDALVLDFFAGSGTTGQAVVELNQEDGGNRKFILATNNENNIAEKVTYERMKRVSSGTDKYNARPMNLKYFKTNFIDKQVDDLENSLLNNVKTLIELKHGIDLNESDVAVVTKRSDIKELDVSNLSTIYMRSQTHKMLDRQQLDELQEIKIVDIPETFFPLEMKEAGL